MKRAKNRTNKNEAFYRGQERSQRVGRDDFGKCSIFICQRGIKEGIKRAKKKVQKEH